MHDCPTCKVPLHGHEEFCPSCGTKQRVTIKDLPPMPKPPGVNPLPIIIALVTVACIGYFCIQQSWIGQVLRAKPEVVDPIKQLTYAQARDQVESKLTQGMTAVNAKGKFVWKSGDKPVEKNQSGPVDLEVTTKLASPDQHKAIVEPVKDYLEQAKISSLVFADDKAHAKWTYSVSAAPPAPGEAPQAPAEDASNPKTTE